MLMNMIEESLEINEETEKIILSDRNYMRYYIWEFFDYA